MGYTVSRALNMQRKIRPLYYNNMVEFSVVTKIIQISG